MGIETRAMKVLAGPKEWRQWDMNFEYVVKFTAYSLEDARQQASRLLANGEEPFFVKKALEMAKKYALDVRSDLASARADARTALIVSRIYPEKAEALLTKAENLASRYMQL